MSGSSRRRAAALLTSMLTGAAVSLAACDAPSTTPAPEPSVSTTQDRPLTVISTDRVSTADPAAVTDQGSAILALNVFQRLMTAEPGEQALKPDAARDCLFTAATVYTCTLNEKETFHNGHSLTSSDVRFSIERARKLDVTGSSATLLSSLRRIETPDPLTVRFVLSRVDTQFGWALASPAASIVDEEVYGADTLRRPQDPIIGSGPFSVVRFANQNLILKRYPDYLGRTPAQSADVTFRTVADSAAVEEALRAGSVDVVWRGPSSAAIIRYVRQAATNAGELTDDGYTLTDLTGTRVRMLDWSAGSPRRADADVREAVSAALQGDRTLDSVIPGGVPGHTSAFRLGGRAAVDVTWKEPVRLDLGYDPTAPDAVDVATQIATRLEATGGFVVRLRSGTAEVDLVLADRKAFTATGQSWLQPYLQQPLPRSAEVLATLEQRYRTRTEEPEALRVLAAIQSQAALDQTVVPVSQGDEYLIARSGVQVQDTSFGPGWQLGLFGIRRV